MVSLRDQALKFHIRILSAFLALLFSAAGFAQATSVVSPRSKAEIQSSITLPTSATCRDLMAFDVTLGETLGASPVTIVEADLPWAGSATVTEFSPRSENLPFTRFFVMTTRKSKKVEWVMAVAFFGSQELAESAATATANWYAETLGVEVQGELIRRLRHGDLTLNVLAIDGALRVGCEHLPTQRQGMKEIFGDDFYER